MCRSPSSRRRPPRIWFRSAFLDVTAKPVGKVISLTGAEDDIAAAEKFLKQNDAIPESDVRVSENYSSRTGPDTGRGLSAEAG